MHILCSYSSDLRGTCINPVSTRSSIQLGPILYTVHNVCSKFRGVSLPGFEPMAYVAYVAYVAYGGHPSSACKANEETGQQLSYIESGSYYS